MKRFVLIALATLSLATSVVHAQSTATSTFNVNLTLTPKCYVNMAGTTPGDVATADVTLGYTAFQNTDAQANTAFKVRCTNTYPYSIGVAADTATIAGITYYVGLAAGTTPSYPIATGGAALGSLSGTGSDQQYTIGVNALKGQPGTCTAASGNCIVSNLHTITVTY